MKLLSHVWLFATPWTVAYQALQSMECSKQEYWSGLPFPSPGDLSNPRMEPTSPALEGRFFTTESPGKPWCSPVAEYKANKELLIMFLNNRNKQMETEKKLNNIKNTKYCGKIWLNNSRPLHSKQQLQLKEIKEGLYKWREAQCLWIETLYITRISILDDRHF